MQPYQNLSLWAVEQPALTSFVHLPDSDNKGIGAPLSALQPEALRILDDTFGEGVSQTVLAMCAAETVFVEPTSQSVNALTWPMYQARALQYASVSGLPLVSDDLRVVPPLPQHQDPKWNTKALAQQLAVEAVSLVLPKFRSVEPSVIPEFRQDIQPLARPFRMEMVKMTSELGFAIASGATETDLRALCKHIAQARVLPALEDLSRRMNEPLRPWHRTVLDVTEGALSAVASVSTSLPELVIAWALFRGAKIASDYAKVYTDREGLKKSGLAFLLKLRRDVPLLAVSEWDQRDWRCSGNVDVPEPGHPLTPENREMLRALDDGWTGWSYRTVRRVFQHRTVSYAQFLPPRGPDKPSSSSDR